MPNQSDLVLVKVSKIMPHGAYCDLVEYNISAYLPISEIASGWIKNIHEFIKEGQKDVAKVISVDREKRVVDISLKKATTKEKADKISEYNLEKRAEKLFGQALIAAKNEDKKEKIKDEIAKKVSTYTELITNIEESKALLVSLKYPEFAASLAEIVAKNTKPKRYTVSYVLDLRSINTAAGITTIKTVLEEIEKQGVNILYLGAPRYRLTSEDINYPKAEGRIKEAQKILEEHSKQLTFSMKSDRV